MDGNRDQEPRSERTHTERRYGYGSERQREEQRNETRIDIDERRNDRRVEILDGRRNSSPEDSSEEEGMQPNANASILQDDREEEAKVTEGGQSGEILAAEPIFLSPHCDTLLMHSISSGYATFNELTMLESITHEEIPIHDISDEISSANTKIAKLQRLLAVVVDVANDSFIYYQFKALKGLDELCLPHYLEARYQLLSRFNEMTQEEFNKCYAAYKKYTEWVDQCITLLDDMATGLDGVNTTEDYTFRQPILSYQAYCIRLLEICDIGFDGSMDHAIIGSARNNDLDRNVTQVTAHLQAYLNLFEADYFLMLKNYLEQYVAVYEDVKRQITEYEDRNIPEEEFGQLRKDYVECYCAFLLLQNHVESPERQAEWGIRTAIVKQSDEEEQDDDESEWEPIPSDSEEEGELGPAPDVQDTNLLTVQLSHHDILEKGDDYKCCMCLEGYIANVDVLECPACHNHYHEDCILHHLTRRINCPLCRHKLR